MRLSTTFTGDLVTRDDVILLSQDTVHLYVTSPKVKWTLAVVNGVDVPTTNWDYSVSSEACLS